MTDSQRKQIGGGKVEVGMISRQMQAFEHLKADLLNLLVPCVELITAIRSKIQTNASLISQPEVYIKAVPLLDRETILERLSLD